MSKYRLSWRAAGRPGMIGVMLLHGTWSDAEIHPDSPEFGTVTFNPDGTGWLLWESWSSSFDLQRFTWLLTGPAEVELRCTRHFSGTWAIGDDDEISHTVETDEPSHEVVTAAFTLTEDLVFDRHLVPGTIGDRFQRVDDAQDPTT